MNAVDTILAQRVIGIIRSASADEAVHRGRSMLAAGLRAIEVALTTPGALDAIRTLVAEAPDGVAIGAGTVLDPGAAADSLAAGAAFLVAPGLGPKVIAAAHAHGAAAVPGVLTPTEMLAARDAGADLIKVFPASATSPAALRDVLAALPDLRLVPTGGITMDAAPSWIAAGAVAVGLGSGLSSASPSAIATLLDGLATAE